MSHDCVTLQVQDAIAHVQLNRPDKHNALNMHMFNSIDKTIKHLAKRKDVRVVIVSGQGQSFCSGLDVKSVMSSAPNALKLLFKWLPGNANLAQRVSVGWRRLKVPVIMVLHGKCWGGGMQIALGGDYRIAAPDTSLSIMEAKWGLIPDMGGTPGLRACVTSDHAIRLATTAEIVTAQQALSYNLISQVSEKPIDAAYSLAKQLVQRSPDTNATVKQMYNRVWVKEERRILAKESLNQIRMIMGKNQKIAVKREMTGSDIPYR